jgi:hypothetical protein
MTVQQFASMGGKARAEKLSAKELSDQGKAAVAARWGRKKKKKPQDPTAS